MWDKQNLEQEIYYKPNKKHQSVYEEVRAHCSEAKGWGVGGMVRTASKEDWGGYWNDYFMGVKDHSNVCACRRELGGMEKDRTSADTMR